MLDTSRVPFPSVRPYGGKLVDLLVSGDEREHLVEKAGRLPSLQLSTRSLCDLELLAAGAFSPLDRFVGRADYRRILEEMRLADGTLFPIPVALPVSPSEALEPGVEIALRSPTYELLAVMTVEEIFPWDLTEEALHVYGTTDVRHPLVAEMASWGKCYISGPLRVLNLPKHHDFTDLRRTPAEVRRALEGLGHQNVVAFQTRNPMHRAHEELTKRAAEQIQGALLIHPAVGMTKPGDVEHYARVQTYRALVERYYDPRRTLLSLVPLAMRLAGPREAVWHAIIRRNYGANHFIVGRDHASPGLDSHGKPFYDPYAAQQLLGEVGDEIGVRMLAYSELVYLPERDRYEELDELPDNATFLSLSGSTVRDEYLAKGKLLPAWFSRPEVATILARAYPPRHDQGFCIWFTGLPCAGKSTIADILTVMLMERGRRITLLDGDVVRTHLSRGLGFTKEDRDINIRRIAFVASEIVRHNGAAICAAVSPYHATRNEARALVGPERFILVYVDTPLEVCEARDTKGLYARARRGELPDFTGVDDPYEAPTDADVTVTTTGFSPEDNARQIIGHLAANGFFA